MLAFNRSRGFCSRSTGIALALNMVITEEGSALTRLETHAAAPGADEPAVFGCALVEPDGFLVSCDSVCRMLPHIEHLRQLHFLHIRRTLDVEALLLAPSGRLHVDLHPNCVAVQFFIDEP
mmetsp:Transcript_7413/g.19446  ORF Transcript_7413/g.19446 Transcript_7413/m.19446 type:complete len:121 (-) Transcript_7413:56-418(-)